MYIRGNGAGRGQRLTSPPPRDAFVVTPGATAVARKDEAGYLANVWEESKRAAHLTDRTTSKRTPWVQVKESPW